ncbi:alpha/beta fold hydrolase [Streptomyces sp. NPDC050418]|uniref:bifunctional 3-oxoadipate enol-lactonase/4-carboxymuconolactone decarboxylase PcaDC n=1 Tax=Streptomyces sp. NPDC050418 TaxID=3365612 RepID=UPI0037A0685B
MTTPHHTTEGSPTAPPLLLGPSLGTSTALWDAVAPELSTTHHVIRFDLPGHGHSPASLIKDGATIADLAALVLHLADELGLDRFAYAGVSISGAIGLHLAAHHPERIERLAVLCSSARFGDPQQWLDRAALVRREGLDALAAGAPDRWFTPAYSSERLVDDHRTADPRAYASCCDALASYDLRAHLPVITAPTLLVAGREDPATPPAHLRELADGITGSTLTEIPNASHLAVAESPGPVLAALRGHFTGPAGLGMAVRREVLGTAHVNRAQQRQTELTARFQDFITRYAWGEIWTDETLSRREHSMITLTALVAGGHLDELALHVRAARRNGLTPREIAAVVQQCAVYVGVPAANAAFGVVQGVLEDS